MTDDCRICQRIAMFERGGSPYLVAEMETGYVALGDNQTYEGYTYFLCKRCVPELHELEPEFRDAFLRDMATVAEAVFRAFAPRKLNYEMLGNSEPHLHWHLIPRYADDPLPAWPVWSNAEYTKDALGAPPAGAERIEPLREKLRAELERLRGR
jgi:diadenosine tetraphosphate (Ap4A) HIT family hydrolase